MTGEMSGQIPHAASKGMSATMGSRDREVVEGGVAEEGGGRGGDGADSAVGERMRHLGSPSLLSVVPSQDACTLARITSLKQGYRSSWLTPLQSG